MKQSIRTAIKLTWLIAATLATSVAWADDPFQSLESIRIATRTFLDQRVNAESDRIRFRIDVDQLDLNLRLPACPVDLEGFLPLGGRLHGRTTVGVRCPIGPNWTIYVPARVNAFRQMHIGALTNGTAKASAHKYG